ncbi:Hypothetical protein FKW44_004427, partial [Caligus rogercresseyi]
MSKIFNLERITTYIKKKLKDKKASGIDGIDGKVFKRLPEKIAPFFLQIGESMELKAGFPNPSQEGE